MNSPATQLVFALYCLSLWSYISIKEYPFLKESDENFHLSLLEVSIWAEEELIEIYFTKGFTEIPAFHKRPMAGVQWRTIELDSVRTLRDIKGFAPIFLCYLSSEPTKSSKVGIYVQCPEK